MEEISFIIVVSEAKFAGLNVAALLLLGILLQVFVADTIVAKTRMAKCIVGWQKAYASEALASNRFHKHKV